MNYKSWHGLKAFVIVSFFSLTVLQFNAGAAEQILPKEREYLAQVRALKAPHDFRKFRSFVLPNQLEVLLVQDPAASKSAAAVDVGVGHLNEPKEYPGLAHYLEHMLFLGTKEYPVVDSIHRVYFKKWRRVERLY